MLDSLAVCSCCRGPPRRSLMTLSTYTPHFICMDAVEFLFWYKIDVFQCTVALNMHQELLILCCRGRLETAVALDLSFRFKKTKKQLWAASSCFWLSVQVEWDDFPAVLLMQWMWREASTSHWIGWMKSNPSEHSLDERKKPESS